MPFQRCFKLSRESRFAVILGFFSVLVVASSSSLQAAPYTPKSPNQVLLKLSPSVVQLRKANDAEQTLSTFNPSKAISIEKAKTYIQTAHTTNQPRWYGYAEAQIKPWWNESRSNLEVAFIKATILQYRHQFLPALEELNWILQALPKNPQALLIRAQVNLMLANFKEANTDCKALIFTASPAIGINCLAQVMSKTGMAEQALARLFQTLKYSAQLSDIERAEIHTTMATTSHGLNQLDTALHHYRQAFALTPYNAYLVEQYSDLLLETNSFKELDSIKHKTSLTLDLRVKLARVNAHNLTKTTNQDINYLRDEFAVARLSDEHFPYKEFAKFSLYLSRNYEQALASALKNWQIQQSTDDALLVLKSAYASQQPSSAHPVIEWVGQTGLDEYRINQNIKLILANGDH